MVVFTCNHCGESLRKQGIEKHYSFVCRNVKSVTCVDCFKDFREEEYVAHTKCLTEEERYAAKGSLPNGVVKKGELKQESWVDMVKSILKDDKLTAPQRSLLSTISSYNNIPRKKPKFLNFIRSSSGGRVNMKVVEDVWNIIESYKINKGKQQQDSKKRKNFENTLNNDTNTHSQKKKKKLEEPNGLNHSNNINDTDVHQSKKKIRKNNDQQQEINLEETQKGEVNKEANGIDDNSNNILDISNTEVHHSKKKKKKNKHQDQEIDSVEYQKGEVDIKEEIENNDMDNSSKVTELDQSKKTKNKHKHEEIDSMESQVEKNDTLAETSTEDLKPTGKFDFQAQIIRILEKKTLISLNKLQKKVINAHLKYSGEVETNPKIIKRFNKSLKKISNIEIVDNCVSFKTN
ncbi:cell growth-regulating nucleolar protein [Diorhabda carinulata]|uniref:cell growth-regulating nucleolar protein n=1 Tax=Diorhabda carinulata TaxID=1163345 RepID=UPI0025A051C1|nr:cell growth-regulating nucleolar protein [Diorhabda carinulata]